MSDLTEPLWRVTLYWGTVVTFFTLPLAILTLHLTFIAWPEILHGNAPVHVGEFKYVFEFHRTLAALVFGLAGLQTTQLIATKHFERADRTEPTASRQR
jgi:hypothetical protein